jgi:hypothetical protein
MNYWLDLFTGTTWREFRDAGCRVSGHSHHMRGTVARIARGDILLCYLTGVMRWVGALEVIGPSRDKSKIWSQGEFPVRLDVKPLILLDPDTGVPMEALRGKVHFYQTDTDKGRFRGFLRGSPHQFKRTEDGQLVLELLRQAEASPVSRPVDPRKLAKIPQYRVQRRRGSKMVAASVTVPEVELISDGERPDETKGPTHTEIEWRLLTLGSAMGLDLWVARNDRSREWQGKRLAEIKGIIEELPTQFNEATNRTIELIDVLWLKGNSIVAAFEVEHTTSIFSGLLRMSDLLALQPNLEIKLYLVGPDERREKFFQEIKRPTFAIREKPLHTTCGFVPYSKLCEYVDQITRLDLAGSLQPKFLDKIADYFEDDDGRA